jgi:hypothetical protein
MSRHTEEDKRRVLEELDLQVLKRRQSQQPTPQQPPAPQGASSLERRRQEAAAQESPLEGLRRNLAARKAAGERTGLSRALDVIESPVSRVASTVGSQLKRKLGPIWGALDIPLELTGGTARLESALLAGQALARDPLSLTNLRPIQDFIRPGGILLAGAGARTQAAAAREFEKQTGQPLPAGRLADLPWKEKSEARLGLEAKFAERPLAVQIPARILGDPLTWLGPGAAAVAPKAAIKAGSIAAAAGAGARGQAIVRGAVRGALFPEEVPIRATVKAAAAVARPVVGAVSRGAERLAPRLDPRLRTRGSVAAGARIGGGLVDGPLGSRGVTFRRSPLSRRSGTPPGSVVFQVSLPDGTSRQVLASYITKGQRAQGKLDINITQNIPGKITLGDEALTPIGDFRFNLEEMRDFARVLRANFPDAKTLVGDRQTVGRLLPEKLASVDLDRLVAGGAQPPTTPPPTGRSILPEPRPPSPISPRVRPGEPPRPPVDVPPEAAVPGNVIFHGTRSRNLQTFLDKEGNLVLRSSENFAGKQVGVSFSESAETARDFASRVPGGGPVRSTAQGMVFEIDRSAIPLKLFREAADELATRGPEQVVIPKGSFRIISDVPAQNKLAGFVATGRSEARRRSRGGLLEDITRGTDAEEMEEWARTAEGLPDLGPATETIQSLGGRLAPGLTSDIAAEFGTISPRIIQGRFAFDELVRRVRVAPNREQFLDRFLKKFPDKAHIDTPESLRRDILEAIDRPPTVADVAPPVPPPTRPPGGAPPISPRVRAGESPRAPASSIDEMSQRLEAAAAQRRIQGIEAPPPRKPGEPFGADMGTPPPRSPHTGLLDDLELPTWEHPKTGIMRKWEGARGAEALAMEEWHSQGVAQLKRLGLTPDKETMLPLFRALHGEVDPTTLSPALREVYEDVRTLVVQETSDFLAFLRAVDASDASTLMAFDAKNFAERMMAHPDYFPRGWKPRKPVAGAAPRGRLGTTPGLAKPRVDASFSEMLDFGFDPQSWNPYAMMAQRRISGTEYRESVILINRLRQRGLAEFANEAPDGWRVPDVGPVLQGRPIIDPNVQGGVGFTRQIAVPSDVASFMESAFGKGLDVRIADRNIIPFMRMWSTFFKRVKLALSPFQHIDFGARSAAAAFTPTAIRSGAPLKFPSFAARLIQVQWSPKAQANLRRLILSDKPMHKGFSLTPKMLVEEGWGVQGDLSLIRREVGSFLQENAPGGVIGRVRKIQEFWEAGLFDGVYRLAQLDALEKFIVPQVRRANPTWTARQVAGEAASQVNVMFSTLGRWQSVLKSRGMRELFHNLAFSSNESEALIRSAFGTIAGPNRRLWQEFYLGAFLSMAFVANLINFSATGQPLPLAAYSPIRINDPYALWKVGYNSKFLSPQLPLIRGRNGEPVYLDIVGQLDTAFRWVLDPIQAAASRINVIPRAFESQRSARSFFGEELRSVQQRAVQAAIDVFAPIGVTSAIGAAREAFPQLRGVVAEGEGRLGVFGQLLQTSGFNLRSQPTRRMLDVASQAAFGIPYGDLEPFERDLLQEQPNLKDELARRQSQALDRDDVNTRYFARLDEIEEERLAKLNEIPTLRLSQREAQTLYFSATEAAANFRAGAAEDFNREFKEADLNDPDPNKRALAEYFGALSDSLTPARNFLGEKFDGLLARLRYKWAAEGTLSYVERNTHRRTIPVGVFRLLPPSVQTPIDASRRARANFDRRQRQQ